MTAQNPRQYFYCLIALTSSLRERKNIAQYLYKTFPVKAPALATI